MPLPPTDETETSQSSSELGHAAPVDAGKPRQATFAPSMAQLLLVARSPATPTC